MRDGLSHRPQEDFMNPRFLIALAALVLLGLTSCGSDSTSTPGSGFGDLTVYLTDAPSPEYKAVYVSINQVEVKRSADDDDNGWQVVDIVNETINLLDLSGGILESLGTRNLPAGEYNQLRLRLAEEPDDGENLNGEGHTSAHYVILGDDTEEELTVPSGYQSGIKLVKQFTIDSLGLTELILDFDAMKSVVQAGGSGNWLLKPVIEVLDTVTMAQIEGTVRDASAVDLQGAQVSAQIYNSFVSDEKDRITVQAGTLTPEDGAYTLRMPEGEYRIIAYKEGFRPQCRFVTANPGDTLDDVDFSLVPSDSGTLTIKITGLATTDEIVTISVRRTAFCTGGSTIARPFEVTSRSHTKEFFAGDGETVFRLPVRSSSAGYTGEYTVVVSGPGMTTQYRTEPVTSVPNTIIFRY